MIMKADIAEHLFPSRDGFRAWLYENAETSDGVWLVFGKTKEVATLTAKEALEEALCFGWIDGQMKRVDETKYIKYFARRRAKSVWSVTNKTMVEELRKRGMMTELGEKAVEVSKENGMWDARTAEGEREMIEAFKEKLTSFPSAYENFMKLPPSAQLAEVRWYHLYKTEERQQQTFNEIVDKLNKM